jgi:hypothetical protein
VQLYILPTQGRVQQVQSLRIHEYKLSEFVVFLTAVMEQLVNIKFCVKLGKTWTETYEMLQTVYDDEALSSSKVFERFNQRI